MSQSGRCLQKVTFWVHFFFQIFGVFFQKSLTYFFRSIFLQKNVFLIPSTFLGIAFGIFHDILGSIDVYQIFNQYLTNQRRGLGIIMHISPVYNGEE